jgi:cyclohexyl-isocyanide hydratase
MKVWRDSTIRGMHVAMLAFQNLTQLDLTGPFEVFARMPDARIDIVAKTRDAVVSDRGLALLPTATFGEVPSCDLLFVPGGPGTDLAMLDETTVTFVRDRGTGAQTIVGVCSGALLLGAAGLLDGYDAATHWTAMALLPRFGARPVEQRVVHDRNRITGGGVTAGIDVALSVVAALYGQPLAEEIQLAIEYDPQPPFHAGSPRTAGPEIVARVVNSRTELQARRVRAVNEAAGRLGK